MANMIDADKLVEWIESKRTSNHWLILPKQTIEKIKSLQAQDDPTIPEVAEMIRYNEKIEQILILMFAFRYALGRKSVAPSVVIEVITRNWETLHENNQKTIHAEIEEFLDVMHDPEDYSIWKQLLDLPISEVQ